MRRYLSQNALASFVFLAYLFLPIHLSAQDLGSFSDNFICEAATLKLDGRKTWNTGSDYKKYFKEASRRELSCLEGQQPSSVGKQTYVIPESKKEGRSNSLGEGEKALLKIGIIGIACALTSDPAACLNGAAGSTSSLGTTSVKSANDCTSDFSCSIGEKCVKKPYSSSGVCMKTVNQYGAQTYGQPSSSSVGVRRNNSGCTFTSDCPIGFSCDLTYKVCVKP